MRSLRSAFDSVTPDEQEAAEPISAENRTNRARQRLTAHRWSTLRRRLSALALLLLLIALIFTFNWAERSGRLDTWQIRLNLWFQNRLAAQGVAAPSVNVSGLGFTTHSEVHRALGAFDLQPLTSFDPHRIAQRLQALPWVKQAEVQRLWPQTLNIWITEKVPLAVLHRSDEAYIVDQTGSLITEATADMIRSLPNIAGQGAQSAAPELLAKLQEQPEIFTRFIGATRLSNRRWNLYLEPGIEVKLPAGDLTQSLARLQQLNKQDLILDRDITVLDLRGRRALIIR